MNTGEKIRYERKKQGLSMKALGQLIGMSEQAISQYERGLRKISFDTLKKIANVLNLPISTFNPDEKIELTELGNGIYAFGLGKTISFSDMINSLDDPFLGRSKEEIINMCEYASKILEASNIKITCVKDKEFDYLIHIMNYNTGKNIYMQYDQFFVEAEKITWFMKNEISTIMEGDALE